MREAYNGPIGFKRLVSFQNLTMTADDTIAAADPEEDIAQLTASINLATLRSEALSQVLSDQLNFGSATVPLAQFPGIVIIISTTIVASNDTAAGSIRFKHQVRPPVGAALDYGGAAAFMSIVSVTAGAAHTWSQRALFSVPIPGSISSAFTGTLVATTRWDSVGGVGQIRPVAAANIEGGHSTVEIWI